VVLGPLGESAVGRVSSGGDRKKTCRGGAVEVGKNAGGRTGGQEILRRDRGHMSVIFTEEGPRRRQNGGKEYNGGNGMLSPDCGD